jgi:sorbose reductase
MKVGEAGQRQPQPVPNIPDNVLSQFGMRGKVVAVNGAADGIGYAVAEAMAEVGADVAMWYNSNSAAVKKAAALAEKFGVKVKAYQVQVTDPKKVEDGIAQIVKDFGKLDVFVANAGIANSKPVLDMSIDEYKALTSVNLDGVFYCAKFAGTVFKKQGFGNLIITSSISAHIVNVPVDQPVYNATKAAVSHLGKSLAREWRDFARCVCQFHYKNLILILTQSQCRITWIL